jgi:hypothetical protein
LTKEKHDIQEELSSFIRDTDSEIAKIKAASLFLVRYGIDTTDPSASNFTEWLSDPLHLPMSERYVHGMLELGTSVRDASLYKSKMMEEGMTYVNRLSQIKGLQSKVFFVTQ